MGIGSFVLEVSGGLKSRIDERVDLFAPHLVGMCSNVLGPVEHLLDALLAVSSVLFSEFL